MPNTCKTCLNEIKTIIFKNTGYCSVDCEKAAGIDHPPYGNMMIVTPPEQALVEKRRRSQAVRNGTPR